MEIEGRSVDGSPGTKKGAHRVSRKRNSVIGRTVVVGGAAVCIGLLAEMNVPDANALSILLPGGNGNATQINILEGNIFMPQFGLGGNGSNFSNNRTIGGIIFGGLDPTGKSHVIALGGAKGSGNVTQINIASYNIFNPQTSIFGSNTSNNTTISNVSAANGNGVTTTSADAGGLGGLFGPALGAGNTTQLSLLSSNIFNPQLSLFGNNTSNNTAVTNVSAINGNGSPTATTGGGIFGGAFNPITGSRQYDSSRRRRRQHRQSPVQPAGQQHEQQPGFHESVVLQRQFQPDEHRGRRPRSVHGRPDGQRQFESVRRPRLQHRQPAGHLRRSQLRATTTAGSNNADGTATTAQMT